MVTRLAFLTLAAAGLLTLALLSFHLLGRSQPASAQAPVTFSIDVDGTGNTATSYVDIDKCVRVDGAGGFDGSADARVDVVATGDTQAPTTYDAWVTYQSSLANIVGPVPASTDQQIKLGGCIDGLSDTPNSGNGTTDSDGSFNAACGYLFGGPGTPGDGTILKMGVDIDFSAGPGVINFGFAKTVYISGAGTHAVTTVPGKIAVNMDCPLDSADVTVVSAITASPAHDGRGAADGDMNVSENQTITVTTTGSVGTTDPPASTMQVRISHSPTLPLPAGCTVTPQGPTSWTGGIAENSSQPLVTVYDIHCTDPSLHTFSFDSEIELLESGFACGGTPAPTVCATDTTSVSIEVWATADVKIIDFSPVDLRMIDSNGDTTPDLPVVDVSTPTVIVMRNLIHNNGGYGPVDVWVDKTATVISGAGTGTVDPTVVDDHVVPDVPVSVDIPADSTEVPESFTIHCDDSNVGGFLTVRFTNTIEVDPTNPHIVDDDLGNNSSGNVDITWMCVPRFTPTFDAIIDLDDDTQNDPVTDICLPGVECKSLTVVDIPADDPKQPLALIQNLYPAAFTIAPSSAVTNAAKVGKIKLSVTVHLQGLTPGCVQPIVDAELVLADAAMPSEGYDWSGLSLFPDWWDVGGGPGPYGLAYTAWAGQLDSVDTFVQVQYGDIDADTIPDIAIPLIAHYNGVAVAVGNPVNVLVWDLSPIGMGYLTIRVTGNPDADLDTIWDFIDPDDDGDLVPDTADNCADTANAGQADSDGDGIGDACDLNPGVPSVGDADKPDFQCSPYNTQTLLLGETEDNPDTGAVEPDNEFLKSCDAFGAHDMIAVLGRADTGEIYQLINTVTCISAATDLSVDLIKNENITVPEDLTHTETITVHIENTVGPTTVGVDLAQVSLDRNKCVSHLVPEPGDTLDEWTVGNHYYSQLSWVEPSLGTITSPPNTRDVTRDYEIVCSEPGDHGLIEQFLVTVTPLDLDELVPLDNTDGNHVSVVSDPDIDGDTVPNAGDNCPLDANPDQTDTNGDGIGDVCVDDDDNDGILDADDDCPLVAGDPGPAGYNGCPMSDVSIGVVKEETPTVVTSVPTAYPVQVTVTNGVYAGDVDVDILLISEDPAAAAGCTVSWGDAQEGLSFAEKVLDGKLRSLLSGTISMAADEVKVLNLTASIHCFEAGLHVDAFELAGGVAPRPPVWEYYYQNNIHENWPDVNALPDVDGDGVPDGVDNCVDTPNPGQEDLDGEGLGDACDPCVEEADCDGDQFNDYVEQLYLGTDPLDACPDWTGTPGLCPGPSCDGHDAWPLDLNVDRDISFSFDVLQYRGKIAWFVADHPEVQRLDLNADGDISFSFDVLLYRGRISETCT